MRKDRTHKINRTAYSRKKKYKEVQLEHLHDGNNLATIYEEGMIDEKDDLIR